MYLNNPTAALSLVSFASLAAGINWDCSDIRVDGKKWDLSALGGVHSVYSVTEHPPVTKNTTFTFDICRPLKKTECQTGTNSMFSILLLHWFFSSSSCTSEKC